MFAYFWKTKWGKRKRSSERYELFGDAKWRDTPNLTCFPRKGLVESRRWSFEIKLRGELQVVAQTYNAGTSAKEQEACKFEECGTVAVRV
jgi:hypothetical protein